MYGARTNYILSAAGPLLLIKSTSSSTMTMPVNKVQGKAPILTQLSWWTSPNPTEQPLSLLVTRPRIILRAAAAATLSWRSALRPKGADRPGRSRPFVVRQEGKTGRFRFLERPRDGSGAARVPERTSQMRDHAISLMRIRANKVTDPNNQ